jgi:hypothetical protein
MAAKKKIREIDDPSRQHHCFRCGRVFTSPFERIPILTLYDGTRWVCKYFNPCGRRNPDSNKVFL